MSDDSLNELNLENSLGDEFDEARSSLLAHFKSYHNESAAYSSFEKYSGLSRKTLKSFLNGERKPRPNTFFSFFKWLYKNHDEKEVFNSLDHEIRDYLVRQGYSVETDRKEITDIVCKSSIHLELYLMTEDNQTVSKKTIQRKYGEKGLEALHDLLLENILLAIDETTFTSGQVRGTYSNKYFKKASTLAPEIFPWERIEQNSLSKKATCSLGNIIIPSDKLDRLSKLIEDFEKGLIELHQDGLKETLDKREKFAYSLMAFKPRTESLSTEGGEI